MGRLVHRITGQVTDTTTGEVLKAGWGGPWLGSMAHCNNAKPTVRAQAIQSNGALHRPTSDPDINPQDAVDLANRLVVRGIVDANPETAYPPEWLSGPGDSGGDLSAGSSGAESAAQCQVQSDVAYPAEWLPDVHTEQHRRSGIQWEGTD